jgi:hypothetical protein
VHDNGISFVWNLDCRGAVARNGFKELADLGESLLIFLLMHVRILRVQASIMPCHWLASGAAAPRLIAGTIATAAVAIGISRRSD